MRYGTISYPTINVAVSPLAGASQRRVKLIVSPPIGGGTLTVSPTPNFTPGQGVVVTSNAQPLTI